MVANRRGWLVLVVMFSVFLFQYIFLTGSSLEKINQNHMDKNRTTYLENKLDEGYNSIKGSQEGVKIINHSEFSSNDRLEEDCFNKSNITSLNDKRVKIRALNVACLSRGKSRHNNAIFFLECTKIFKFKSVQWCSIESAARHNPKKDIIVMFLYYNTFEAPTIMKKLLSTYPNIHFAHISKMSELVRDSPYENALKCTNNVCEVIEESIHQDYHYSDLMRVLVGYKFGGLYSDLDIVTLKDFPDTLLPNNFVVADVSRRLGNCFFKFNKGHPFLNKLMQDIVSNYNSTEWSANGPDRLTQSFKEYCDNLNDTLPHGTFGSRNATSQITMCVKDEVNEIGVLGPTYISLVHWNDIKVFFRESNALFTNLDNQTDVISQIKKFDSIAIHFYNKITHNLFGRKYENPNLPFKKLFSQNCPLTYEAWYTTKIL